jgi:hypothetical protein
MSKIDAICFVGIDVSKDLLEIAVRPSGEQWSIKNDPLQFPALIENSRN